MAPKRYKAISIPEELTTRIEEVLKAGKHGYRTRSEFVVDAIRRRLEDFMAVTIVILPLLVGICFQLVNCLDDFATAC
jgi:hypothetical protein